MDQLKNLTYTDSNFLELGILETYELDFDTADSKDFEIITHDLVMTKGSFFFVDGTEIGGRVDSFKINTSSDTITYTGRNFRGLLSSHIIPMVSSADGNLVGEINSKLYLAGLDNLFVCDYPQDETESLDVSGYVYNHDCTLYDGITALAKNINFNLIYTFKTEDHRVHIVPVFANDFSDYLTYCRDNSLDFEIGVNGGNTNHLIVRGEDEEGYFRTIHLFTDDNYGLKSYSKSSTATYSLLNETWNGDFKEPLQDSDYILDESKQELFGVDEVADVLDTNVRKVDNYILTTERPSTWAANFPFYYTKEIDEGQQTERYNPVEPVTKAVFTLQSKKPTDWNSNYGNYYRHTGTGTTEQDFSPVDAETEVSGYSTLTKKPADWVSTYNLYYSREWIGDEYEYHGISGVNKYSYALQTWRPDHWAEDYNNYWMKSGSHWARPVAVNGKAPTWVKNKYYTAKQSTVAPSWPGTVYIQRTRAIVPTWASGTFYTKTVVETAPSWKTKTYYERVEDHFASLVSAGIKELMNSISADEQTVTLDDFEVTIGDTVGGIDEKTGLTVTESVTNIILKYSNGIRSSIEYKIGGQY